MKLEVIRLTTRDGYTPGELTIDGQHFCWTLEDAIREVPGKAPVEWKVYGSTAIPQGTYKLTINWSNRFKRQMIEILNVPGFAGIRIHNGPTEKSTDGCLLVHYQRNPADLRLKDYDRSAMLEIERLTLAALTKKEQAIITFVNPGASVAQVAVKGQEHGGGSGA